MKSKRKNYTIWVKNKKFPIWNNYAKNKEDALRIVKLKEKGRITKIAKWSNTNSKWEYLKLK